MEWIDLIIWVVFFCVGYLARWILADKEAEHWRESSDMWQDAHDTVYYHWLREPPNKDGYMKITPRDPKTGRFVKRLH